MSIVKDCVLKITKLRKMFRDRVFDEQQKSTINLRYDPQPYTMNGVKTDHVTAERVSKSRVCDMYRVKLQKQSKILRSNFTFGLCPNADSEAAK